MKSELLKGLTEEQIAKLKNCKSQEELLALAKTEGIELNDEQLEAVSGGCMTYWSLVCPECNEGYNLDNYKSYYECNSCHCQWDDEKIIKHGRTYTGDKNDYTLKKK